MSIACNSSESPPLFPLAALTAPQVQILQHEHHGPTETLGLLHDCGKQLLPGLCLDLHNGEVADDLVRDCRRDR